MIEEFITSLNGEIIHYFENTHVDEECMEIPPITPQIIDSFPLLKYLYTQQTIPEVEFSDPNLIVDRKQVIRGNNENTRFLIPTANQLEVTVEINEKDKKKYPKLEEVIASTGNKLVGITDIEFFEKFKGHEKIVRGLRDEYPLSNNPELNNLRARMQEQELNAVDLIFGIMSNDEFDVSKLIDLIDPEKERIMAGQFSALFDTEKIHLQFAQVETKGGIIEPILAYFRYGAHQPFNVRAKNSKELRYNAIDQLSETIDKNYYQRELSKDSQKRTNELIALIDEAQQSYVTHFNANTSYSNQEARFTGVNKTHKNIDQELLMINPQIRSKSAALIAHTLFKNNKIFQK